MSTLLVVHHSPTPTAQALTDAVLAGANDDAIEGVEVVVRQALEATRGRRAGGRRVPARDDGELRLHERRAQALLRHDLPRGGRVAVRRRLGGARRAAARSRSGCGCTVGTTRRARCARCSSIVGALPWTQAAEVLAVLGDVGERAAGGGVRARRDARGPAELTQGYDRAVRQHRGPEAASRALRHPRAGRVRRCLTGCGDGNAAPAADKKAPALGACRVLDPEDVAEARQRDRGRRVRRAAHRRDVRRRRPARRVRRRRTTTTRSSAPGPTGPARRASRSSSAPTTAW